MKIWSYELDWSQFAWYGVKFDCATAFVINLYCYGIDNNSGKNLNNKSWQNSNNQVWH